MRPIHLIVPVVAAALLGSAAAPPDAPSPGAAALLQMLHDRAATLKDFSANVENSTLHLAGDEESKSGDAVFVNDAATGPKFAAHFTKATMDGKAGPTPDEQIVFDGSKITYIDRKAKTFRQTTFTPPAGAASGAGITSLSGPMPLPIGLDPEAVAKDFIVTEKPGPDADHGILKLVPRDRSKFDYKSLILTVDKKLQLPVKIEVAEKGNDLTTITLSDIKVNAGGVTIPSVKAPTDPGWVVEQK